MIGYTKKTSLILASLAIIFSSAVLASAVSARTPRHTARNPHAFYGRTYVAPPPGYGSPNAPAGDRFYELEHFPGTGNN